jgi:hypothetical protein
MKKFVVKFRNSKHKSIEVEAKNMSDAVIIALAKAKEKYKNQKIKIGLVEVK